LCFAGEREFLRRLRLVPDNRLPGYVVAAEDGRRNFRAQTAVYAGGVVVPATRRIAGVSFSEFSHRVRDWRLRCLWPGTELEKNASLAYVDAEIA
jgi:hypothetical protein